MFFSRTLLLIFLFTSTVSAQTFNPDGYWRVKAAIQSETGAWFTVIGSRPVNQDSIMKFEELEVCVDLVNEIAKASDWIEGANSKQQEASDAIDRWKEEIRSEIEQSLTSLQKKADVINQLELKSTSFRRELNEMKKDIDRNSSKQISEYNDKAAETKLLDNEIQKLVKTYTAAEAVHAKKIAELNTADIKQVDAHNEFISELNADAKNTTSERDLAIAKFASSCDTMFFDQNDLRALNDLR